VGFGGGCDQEPKSKRTSPPSSLKHASNGLPDLDTNPLSTGLRPCFSSAGEARVMIRLPAMVFRFANLQQLCQRLHPEQSISPRSLQARRSRQKTEFHYGIDHRF
jgi:hypothetical protein